MAGSISGLTLRGHAGVLHFGGPEDITWRLKTCETPSRKCVKYATLMFGIPKVGVSYILRVLGKIYNYQVDGLCLPPGLTAPHCEQVPRHGPSTLLEKNSQLLGNPS